MEREAVRIDVVLPIEIKEIPAEEAKNKIAKIIGDIPLFSYIPLKDTIDEALNNWLKLINAKLDYLINLLTREKEGFHKLPEKKVNFSEKGLRLLLDKPIEKGHFVEIKTILDVYQPLGFYLYGRVVRCNPKNGKYEVAIEFINLPCDIKDKLSFFVLNKQRELIREHRYA